MLKHSHFLIHKKFRFAHSPFTIIVLCYVCVFFQPMIWKMRFITIMRKYEKIQTWGRSFISSEKIRPGSKKNCSRCSISELGTDSTFIPNSVFTVLFISCHEILVFSLINWLIQTARIFIIRGKIRSFFKGNPLLCFVIAHKIFSYQK